MADFEVNENDAVYYDGDYWNNLVAVQGMFNQRIAGGTPGKWFEDFFAGRGAPSKRALFLNCGNGWVEREMLSAGVVHEGVGIDYSDALLEEARREASTYDLPLTYHQMNVNTAEFPPEEFDLVVNYAAAHHIAMIDRVFREICRLLPQDGCFLSFDYVGPHRNQYSTEAWERAWLLNNELPPQLRQTMAYPHARTMLQIDPTEAIHSELIVETMQRYFHLERLVPLGGAIAYPILTHNQGLFSSSNLAERDAWVDRVLEVDQEFLAENPDATLFAYIVATPNKQVLTQSQTLDEWEQQENAREDRARANEGLYYPYTALQEACDRLVTEHVVSEQLRGQVADLETQLNAIRHDPVVSRLTALRSSRLASELRHAPVVGPLYERLRGD